jgi:hypothetical protein
MNLFVAEKMEGNDIFYRADTPKIGACMTEGAKHLKPYFWYACYAIFEILVNLCFRKQRGSPTSGERYSRFKARKRWPHDIDRV